MAARKKKTTDSDEIIEVVETSNSEEENVRLIKNSSNAELPEIVIDVPDSSNIDKSKFCSDMMRLYYGKYNVTFRTNA